jgi:hypothetical protein
MRSLNQCAQCGFSGSVIHTAHNISKSATALRADFNLFSGARGTRDQGFKSESWVEVGTALVSRPPHGSGRAELPHPALALGRDAYSFSRIRLADSGHGEPLRF